MRIEVEPGGVGTARDLDVAGRWVHRVDRPVTPSGTTGGRPDSPEGRLGDGAVLGARGARCRQGAEGRHDPDRGSQKGDSRAISSDRSRSRHDDIDPRLESIVTARRSRLPDGSGRIKGLNPNSRQDRSVWEGRPGDFDSCRFSQVPRIPVPDPRKSAERPAWIAPTRGGVPADFRRPGRGGRTRVAPVSSARGRDKFRRPGRARPLHFQGVWERGAAGDVPPCGRGRSCVSLSPCLADGGRIGPETCLACPPQKRSPIEAPFLPWLRNLCLRDARRPKRTVRR